MAARPNLRPQLGMQRVGLAIFDSLETDSSIPKVFARHPSTPYLADGTLAKSLW